MSTQLKHIFDKSACLSARQLKDYVNGLMSKDECHALEHHVNSCFFCSEAIEGMTEHHEAVAVTDGLTNSFLKDHFSLTNPQVHLNSMAPAASATAVIASRKYRGKAKSQPLVRTSSIAAIVLIGLGIMWYAEFGRKNVGKRIAASSILAANDGKAAAAAASKEEIPATPAPQPASAQAFVASGSSPDNPEQPKDIPQKLQPLIMTDKKAAEVAMNDNSEASMKNAAKQVAAARTEAKRIEEGKPEVFTSRNVTDVQALPAGDYQRNADNSTASFTSPDTDKAADEAGNKDDQTSQTAKRASVNESAEDLYLNGKWSKALQAYRKEMNVGNSRHRQHAALMAARCHANLGQKAAAIQLLQAIVTEGGSQKKAAQRMLHDLSPDAGE
jgi:hypothetical protein